MNTQKKMQPPWKWNWFKIITGIVTFIVAIASVILFIGLGAVCYPFYVFKRYIKKRIQNRKTF